jgi:purine-nucleoside phosphorylase
MIQQRSIDSIRKIWQEIGFSEAPDLHVVLGSGYGAALESLGKIGWKKCGEVSFSQIPGLVSATVQDHAGKYSFYRHESGRTVCFQMGRLHGYEGHSSQDVVLTVMIPRLAGCKNFILTNAAGGLNKKFKPGHVMLIEDHVNITGQNPLLGPNQSEIGERFPDMSKTYDKAWIKDLTKTLKKEKLGVHKGIYLGTLGPSFETPAEVKLYIRWGLDAVGMSTVWESIALTHSGARLAGISLISNPCAGLVPGLVLHHEKILATCRASAEKVVRGILAFSRGADL